GIARNRLRHHYERLTRRASALDLFRLEAAQVVEAALQEAAAQTHESHLQALLHCISELPERMRRVVRGWLDRERASALAAELQLSVANIYQIQHRASALLRAC